METMVSWVILLIFLSFFGLFFWASPAIEWFMDTIYDIHKWITNTDPMR